MNPASSANRILIGTGLGLILVTGFGLVSGMFDFSSPGFELIFPIVGLALLIISSPLGNTINPLNSLFPDENQEVMASRISSELIQFNTEQDVGDAWAQLEKTVLTKELEEE
ncbi:MAG: hypothetical protein QGI21_05195 [Candidatus Poseidoniaceae archaeon]|jgi:hypothetical protein|nr:hypothetical protein [Candidatus Poseidoniaceae archaeon]